MTRIPLLIGAVLLAGVLALPAGTSKANGYVVTKTTDTMDFVCNADCSLREAIYAANWSPGADDIFLSSGTYTLTIPGAGEGMGLTGDLNIFDNTYIEGVDPTETIIDATGLPDRALAIEIASVSLNYVQVRGGSGVNEGGGIYSTGELPLSLYSSTVTGNSAASGGGIYSSGVVYVNGGSTISGNTATAYDGGGVYASELHLSNSTVSDNFAGRDGGGIYGIDLLNVTNSTLDDNQAYLGGGGIFNPGTATVTNSNFTGNAGYDSGGGIWSSGTLNVTNSTLTGNGGGKGGAISAAAGTVNVTDSSLSGNIGGTQGGGIHLKDANSNIAGTTIANNSIQSGSTVFDGTGAGIYYEGGAHTVNTSSITGNVAKRAGGGMYIEDASVTVADTSIGNNDGYQSGGGILIVSYGPPATLDVARSSIFANSTGFLGGGIDNEGGVVTVSNTTISGNATSSYGGGIMNSSGTVTITNSTLNGNSAATGGGLYRWPGGGGGFNYVYLRNTIVANSPGGNCAGNAAFTNGYNLISDGTCAFPGGGIGEILNTWPELGPLANNGGPTPTHALLDGSPAADAAGAGCPSIDQRGISRPQGLRCDIGAYEAPDTDGDGVSDPADSNDDDDGLVDGFDTCPLVAEDYDAFLDTDGCPDQDNDEDGICDVGQTSLSCAGSDTGKNCFDPAGTLSCSTKDCRNAAEDVDAFKDVDGCPEPDNDNDGKLDAADVCPGTDSLAGANGMLGSPQDLNHNGVRDAGAPWNEAVLTTDDSPLALAFEDYDGVLDADGCHDSPGADFDGDGLTDDNEVFTHLTDAGNPDTDADTVIDGADNCPNWGNTPQNLPTWTIPANDSDCDGFTVAREQHVGTDPTKHCNGTTTVNDEPDAWPGDFNDNGLTNLPDVISFGPTFNKLKDQPGYNQRYDLNATNQVLLSDVILLGPFFNKSCTPG